MSWKRFLYPPLPERRGKKIFVSGVLAGTAMIFMALAGITLEGLRERLGSLAFGAALSMGCAGTLALAYADLTEDSRFALKIAVQIAFLLLGPLAVVMELPFLLETGVWACAAVPCLTIVPFGLSLTLIILKQRKSHS